MVLSRDSFFRLSSVLWLVAGLGSLAGAAVQAQVGPAYLAVGLAAVLSALLVSLTLWRRIRQGSVISFFAALAWLPLVVLTLAAEGGRLQVLQVLISALVLSAAIISLALVAAPGPPRNSSTRSG